MSTLMSVKELQAKIAQAEGDKASAAAKAHAAAEAEKQAFLERLSKPSGPFLSAMSGMRVRILSP